MERERVLVDELKNKIVTRPYNFEDHQVDLKDLDNKEAFKAEALDLGFIERAEQELGSEGLITRSQKKSS